MERPPLITMKEPFMGVSGNVKSTLHEVMDGGGYYVTPKFCRELKHIDRGIDHIRLDNDILSSSKEWSDKFDPISVSREKRGAVDTMQRATGNLHEVKNTINARRIGTQQDNNVREAHHWTMNKLKGTETDMKDYAHESVNRIKLFCDHVGVTDRYTGYRNNLNRGNRDPLRLGYKWLDGNDRQFDPVAVEPALRKTPPTFLPDARSHSQQRSHSAPSCRVPPKSNLTIQEQCGINMDFPGKTEYMNVYNKKHLEVPTRDFIVNPVPDYRSHGRPLAMHKYERPTTEYQTRYLWPDSNRPMMPWLRK